MPAIVACGRVRPRRILSTFAVLLKPAVRGAILPGGMPEEDRAACRT